MKRVFSAFALFLWRDGAKTCCDEGYHRATGGRQVGTAMRSVGKAFYSAAPKKSPGHDRDQEQKSPFQLRPAAGLVQQRTVLAKAQIRAGLKSASASVGTGRCLFPRKLALERASAAAGWRTSLVPLTAPMILEHLRKA